MREDFAACREMYQRDGYVTMKDAVTPEALATMRTQLDIWADESRQHDAPYGQIMDGRPRFDVEPATHGPDTPALRRITSPIEISDDFLAVARDNAALDLLAEVMSPTIKLQASKINLKLPGSGTNVRYHQDFPFEPHSNDDLCTVLIFLDDVTLDNGPLEVVPGTHRGELYTLWHDGVFTGAVDHSVEATHRPNALKCTGRAGDACLMHTRLLHGSLPNMTDAPRRLFIVTYAADDAIPLTENQVPHTYDGEIVRGVAAGRIRTSSYDMDMPEYPKTASFFGQQARSREAADGGAT